MRAKKRERGPGIDLALFADDMNAPGLVRKEGLEETVTHIEEEARMVLPGIQALFGFQLVAVFSERFAAMKDYDRILHLLAIFCTTAAMLLVLMPAAYHRQAEPRAVSDYFAKMATRVLTWALAPLSLALCADLFVITDVVLESLGLSALVALMAGMVFLSCWFIYPRSKRR